MEQPRADNELVPASDAAKPLFSASQLRVTPHRTAEDIQRDIRDGRFAEMTPGQAGEAGEVLWSNLPGHLNRWKIHHLRKKHDNKKT